MTGQPLGLTSVANLAYRPTVGGDIDTGLASHSTRGESRIESLCGFFHARFTNYGGPGGEPQGSPVPLRGCPVRQPVRAAAPIGVEVAVFRTAPTEAIMADIPHCGSPALRTAVQSIDSLSQAGFSEIATIAKFALAWLETPEGYRHTDNIAYALRAIWNTADDIQNCINVQADEVGCGHVDDAQQRRWEARRIARTQETDHA